MPQTVALARKRAAPAPERFQTRIVVAEDAHPSGRQIAAGSLAQTRLDRKVPETPAASSRAQYGFGKLSSSHRSADQLQKCDHRSFCAPRCSVTQPGPLLLGLSGL